MPVRRGPVRDQDRAPWSGPKAKTGPPYLIQNKGLDRPIRTGPVENNFVSYTKIISFLTSHVIYFGCLLSTLPTVLPYPKLLIRDLLTASIDFADYRQTLVAAANKLERPLRRCLGDYAHH